MSNRYVAAALDFIGWGDGMSGEEVGEVEHYVDEAPRANDPPGVYHLRNDRSDFAGMAIVRAAPTCIDEAPQVAEQIKDQLPVIVNLEDVPDVEARRIVDFLGGVIYGLNGTMKKVARSVFICAPFDVPVEQLAISPGRGRASHEDEETADVRRNPL